MRSQAEFLRLREWQAGDTPGPYRVTLFPTYRCNLRCAICERSWRPDPPHLLNELSDERLLRLVDEGAELGVREWLLAGGGDPMVRGDLVMAMCTRIREYGMNGILQTNGTCFKPEQLEQLVQIGWRDVNISIDGPTAEINDAIRSKGAFDKATRAARQLGEFKRKHGSDLPHLRVPMVLTALNCDKLDAMVAFVKEIGGASMELNNLLVFNKREMARLIPSEEQDAALPAYAAQALERAQAVHLDTNLASYLCAAPLARGPEPGQEPRPAPAPLTPPVFSERMCYEPWLTAVFTSHGMVSPCCIFWEDHAQNLHDKTLREVWFGPYMTEVRNLIAAGTPPPYCVRCSAALLMDQESVRCQLRRIEREERFSLNPKNVLAKAAADLKQRGLKESFRRGREWLMLRRAMKRSSRDRK